MEGAESSVKGHVISFFQDVRMITIQDMILLAMIFIVFFLTIVIGEIHILLAHTNFWIKSSP